MSDPNPIPVDVPPVAPNADAIHQAAAAASVKAAKLTTLGLKLQEIARYIDELPVEVKSEVSAVLSRVREVL